MGWKDRLRLAEEAVAPGARIESDRLEFKTGPDGIVRETCWFCGRQVEFKAAELSGEAAVVMMEVLGTHEHLHGLAHPDCARRSQGALQPLGAE
jgi:hypothetical protein